MTDASAHRLVIAVLTYKRPDDLRMILPRLQEQARSVGNDTHILVVDNDPAGSAKEFVTGVGDNAVQYVNETTPGIAAARNRALDESGEFALLVFIDDDEVPTDGWLASLVSTWENSQPIAVVGPVVSEYAVELDAWMRAGRFFDRRRLPTGTVVDVAATNNLLLDLNQLRPLGLHFDARYGLTGGSDTLFTREIHRRGGRLVWCDEAIVMDQVPAERLTREWVLQRAYRSGNSWSRTSLDLADGRGVRRIRAKGALRGMVRLAGGSAQVAVGVITRNIAHRARGTRTVMRGAGLVAGSFGQVYTEYARPSTGIDG